MSENMNGEALSVITGSTLAEVLRRTAEWRREKAAEFPDDSRNEEAADLLESLADSTEELDYEEMAPLNAAADEVDGYTFTERTNEFIGRIGFDHFPAGNKPVHLMLMLAAAARGGSWTPLGREAA